MLGLPALERGAQPIPVLEVAIRRIPPRPHVRLDDDSELDPAKNPARSLPPGDRKDPVNQLSLLLGARGPFRHYEHVQVAVWMQPAFNGRTK